MIKQLFKLASSRLPATLRFQLLYLIKFKRIPRVKRPHRFNEKVLHRILFEKEPLFTELTDKYRVREYISKKIGDEYLIPLLLNTKTPSDLLNLPNWEGCVIKPNHAAGLVFIVNKEPTKEEKKHIISKCTNWLETDFSIVSGEKHYKGIPPRILVEKNISTNLKAPNDYKFHCFRQDQSGYKQILQVITNRSGNKFSSIFFDLDNLKKPINKVGLEGYHFTTKELEAISKIKSLNEVLAKKFTYLRIDWYIVDHKIYFGEMTFTPGAGLSKSFNKKFDVYMGKLWNKL